MTSSAFNTLPLSDALLENLQSLGYDHMTPIQAQSLPHILAGKDVIGQGKTGSGKTAAFGLGLLQRLDVGRFCIQVLVLCPTRELADQVAKEIRRLARTTHNIKVLTLCGGLSIGPQIGSLEHGAHIIVGTPGRVEDHLRKGTLKLDKLTTLVLDEADRMLDMGFQESLDSIVEQAPKQRQTMLFSATFPDTIQSIAKRVMIDPEMVKVESTHDNLTISQHFFRVGDNDSRLETTRLVLLHYRPESAVVFCNTKRETDDVADYLSGLGFSALALHGDMEQRQRDQTLVRFANKSASVLVATDVAARGLDIEALDAVINFHISPDPEVHVHRIGRTGRAGSEGVACSLFNEREAHKLIQIEDYLQTTIPEPETLAASSLRDSSVYQAPMACLQIDGGKKQKVRAGDIVGALTAGGEISGSDLGKIHLYDNWAYVAVQKSVLKPALRLLGAGKIKGKTFRVRHVRG